jgi:hypothetical protein
LVIGLSKKILGFIQAYLEFEKKNRQVDL